MRSEGASGQRSQLSATGVVITSRVHTDGIVITFRSRSDRGAVFHTRTRSPLRPGAVHDKMLTLDPGAQISRKFTGSPGKGYLVEVNGPQALYRRLSGLLTPGPEAAAAVDPQGRGLLLVLTNEGPSVDLLVSDEYAPHRDVVRLAPAAETRHIIPTREGGSYDVTVTSSRDPHFVRRFVGAL